MMRNHRLPLLIALAVAFGGAGIYLSKSREGQSSLSAQNQPLVPGLEAGLNEVSAVKVMGPENKLVADLQRSDKGWVAANKSNYPADVGKIREFLLKLAESRLREEKTANPERHGLLGVEDLAGKDAKGVGVELAGLQQPVKLVIGTYSSTGGQGHFVRRADAPQSWLASGSIRPETTEAAWLLTDVANIPSPRVRQVEIDPPGSGPNVVIEKTDAAAPDYTVLGVPKGRELSSASVGNGISTLLDNLRLEDVAKADAETAAPDPATLHQARFLTVEGVLVKVEGWERDGKSWLKLSAELDPARSEAWLAAEQAKAEAAHQAAQAPAAAEPAKTAEGSTTDPAKPAETATDPAKPAETAAQPAADAPAATPFDAAKFRTEQLAMLQKEIDELNARTAGWAYVVPTWKFANIKKSMEDLLKPKDAK